MPILWSSAWDPFIYFFWPFLETADQTTQSDYRPIIGTPIDYKLLKFNFPIEK